MSSLRYFMAFAGVVIFALATPIFSVLFALYAYAINSVDIEQHHTAQAWFDVGAGIIFLLLAMASFHFTKKCWRIAHSC